MFPTVSVVIPCYNGESYIAETLDSVLSQTFTDYEVIVVDDGSTDKTAQKVQSFSGIKYYRQPNKGPAAARNTGLHLAKGEFLAFLDSDDLWHKDMLRVCLNILTARPEIAAVHANWLPIDAQGNIVKASSGWKPWRGDIFDRLLVHIPFNTSSILWRRECWERIGGFDETPEINDDWINWLRIARRGYHFEAIEDPLVYRRMHEDSITRNQSMRIVQWRLNALDKICSEFSLSQTMCDRAFAEAHWIATTVALRDGQPEKAVGHFRQAITLDPALLELSSTYYAIAYGGRSSDEERFDLRQATERIEWSLDAIFSALDPTTRSRDLEKKARSNALLCLARIAYGNGPVYAVEARRYLLRAIQVQPHLTLQASNFAWLTRILLGPKLVKTGAALIRNTPIITKTA